MWLKQVPHGIPQWCSDRTAVDIIPAMCTKLASHYLTGLVQNPTNSYGVCSDVSGFPLPPLLFLWASMSCSSASPGSQLSSRHSLGYVSPNSHSACQSRAHLSQAPTLYLLVVTDVHSASCDPFGLTVSLSHDHVWHVLLLTQFLPCVKFIFISLKSPDQGHAICSTGYLTVILPHFLDPSFLPTLAVSFPQSVLSWDHSLTLMAQCALHHPCLPVSVTR